MFDHKTTEWFCFDLLTAGSDKIFPEYCITGNMHAGNFRQFREISENFLHANITIIQ